MKAEFTEEYPKYKAKIEKFIKQTSFHERLEQYTKHLEQMTSIDLDAMKNISEKEPAFINARNESIRLMEEIIDTQHALKEVFELNQESLGEHCEYDLKLMNRDIADKIKHSTQLLYDFEIVSKLGQKILEKAHDNQ